MPKLFSPDNAEELICVSRLGLSGIDHLLGYVPPQDTLPSAELGALMRLLSGALTLGLDALRTSNGSTP